MEKKEEDKSLTPFPLPRLDALEKLYVKTYLHTLSHPDAYRAIVPGLKKYKIDNPYALRENVKYHIALSLQNKMESLSLDPNKIIERLYYEAIREGNGSNHSARIQALNLLGKHLGMFSEEKKGDVYQINIVNYDPSTKESNINKNIETPISEIENDNLSLNVKILDSESIDLNPIEYINYNIEIKEYED